MLSETNKTVSRRFFEEVFGKGKLNVLDEIIAKDHVNSGPGTLPGLPNGPEGAKQVRHSIPQCLPGHSFHD